LEISLHLEEKEFGMHFGVLRILSEQTLDIDEEMCACFIDWQMAFDCVNWTKLMLILKENGIACC
jgi:hypothetical protein